MKLINSTAVPDALLRAMIRHCQPPGVHGFDISFKNSGDGTLHGRAYTEGTCYHERNGHCLDQFGQWESDMTLGQIGVDKRRRRAGSPIVRQS